jgi:hypothetical protein
VGTLNKRARQQIGETLDRSVFTAADFRIDYPETDSVLALITFSPEPAYQFKLGEQNYNSKFQLAYAPGQFLETVSVEVETFAKCLESITTWSNNIRADLRANSPLAAEMDELRKSFEQAMNQHVTDPEKHFTKQEAEELRARLDEMAFKFDELHQRNAITEEQLDSIKREIEQLKSNTQSFTKKTFFRTAGNKLLSIFGQVASSKAAQEVLIDATRHALGYGDGPKP